MELMQIFQRLQNEEHFRLMEFKPSLCDAPPKLSVLHFGELTFLRQPKNFISETCGNIVGTGSSISFVGNDYEW